MFEHVLSEIQKYDTIILHRHSKPDGDALGSQIGLKHLLRENFPGKTVYAVGDDARFYGFMEDSVMDDIPDSVYEGALAVILDCGAAHLVSDNRYTLASRTVRIDHHIFGGQFADTEVIDTSFESCCGMIAEFAREQGLRLNPLSAQSLYTGMVTDSGRFRYDATSHRTFRLAALLLEQGFDTNRIYRDLYADDFEKYQKSRGVYPEIWKNLAPFVSDNADGVADMIKNYKFGSDYQYIKDTYCFKENTAKLKEIIDSILS